MLAIVYKERLVNVRLKEQTHQDFKIACELRGASMSSLLHQFIVRTIREEKESAPQAFQKAANNKKLAPVVAHISPAKPSKAEIRRQVIGDDVEDLGTVDYTDAVSRQAERVRLSLLKSDVSPDDAEGFRRAYREATEIAEERIAKKRKAKN